jgi:putative transcriptional regulator
VSAHHPSSELLVKYATAGLDRSLASVVSAHVEHCSACKSSVQRFEQSSSLSAFVTPFELSSLETSEAWQKVSLRLRSVDRPRTLGETKNSILIDGVIFELPRALNNWVSKPIQWMSFGKGGKICKLGNEGGKALFLIYLTPNEEVPYHSHEVSEHSYVVSGSYSADGVQFETGDFSFSNETIVHAPKAGSEDGCLLLSSVENRLNFLQGWLSPLNGFLWWILNLRVKWLQ